MHTVDTNSTVYLVDDSEIDRLAITRILVKAGFQVEQYASAHSFLDSFDPLRVGCLVVDIRMPGLEGPELQQKLKSDGAKTPVIFISGVATVSLAIEAVRLGAIDVLEKPVDSDRLCECVTTGLQLSRAGQERQRIALLTYRELATLTPEEREVLRYVCAGKSLKQISAHFHVDFTTAARHQSRILDKLCSCNPMQLLQKLQAAEFEVEPV